MDGRRPVNVWGCLRSTVMAKAVEHGAFPTLKLDVDHDTREGLGFLGFLECRIRHYSFVYPGIIMTRDQSSIALTAR
jgi:hypothetical protein